MTIKVMLAFSNILFSDGIRKILSEDCNSIKVIDILKPGSECPSGKLNSLNPDVILVDLSALYNSFRKVDTSKKNGFILLDTDCGKDNIVSAFLTKKLSGVLLNNANASLLKKAIYAVAKDEVWVDKSTVKTLLSGINALDKNKISGLSDQEHKIVSLIGQGLRNKEIAAKLTISESTVKTHLNRIFRKLNISGRAHLITFAIKNKDISGNNSVNS